MKLFLKVLLAKLLVNNITGYFLFLIFNGRISFHELKIDIKNNIIKKKIASALFFKTYESSEIRFINNYLKNYSGTIIELGASIGVMSSIISKRNSDATIFAFEADARFLPIIQQNHAINNITNVSVFNEIIGVDGYEFCIGQDNTQGKIVKSDTKLKNSNINLEDILKSKNITDEFVLVSDIEGAEYFVIAQSSKEVFQNCKMLIMELHDIEIDGVLISTEMMIEKIKNLGFTIEAQYAGNIVAKK